jgi:hypothetical protein
VGNTRDELDGFGTLSQTITHLRLVGADDLDMRKSMAKDVVSVIWRSGQRKPN